MKTLVNVLTKPKARLIFEVLFGSDGSVVVYRHRDSKQCTLRNFNLAIGAL